MRLGCNCEAGVECEVSLGGWSGWVGEAWSWRAGDSVEPGAVASLVVQPGAAMGVLTEGEIMWVMFGRRRWSVWRGRVVVLVAGSLNGGCGLESGRGDREERVATGFRGDRGT